MDRKTEQKIVLVTQKTRLEELICRVQTDNAKEYARRLLEQILIRRQFEVLDDMTVLVMRITRPGHTISGENTVQFS